MPKLDGTGPEGKGPTGLRRGNCDNALDDRDCPRWACWRRFGRRNADRFHEAESDNDVAMMQRFRRFKNRFIGNR